jgi:hypothetical protein
MTIIKYNGSRQQGGERQNFLHKLLVLKLNIFNRYVKITGFPKIFSGKETFTDLYPI